MPTPEPTLVTPATLRAWPLPEPGAGKGARGEVLVVGGTAATPGAVLLAGESALRVGAGKLGLVTARTLAAPLGVAVPESAVTGLAETSDGSIDPAGAGRVVELAASADVVLAGPGFSDPKLSVALLAAALPDVDTGLVLDGVGSAFLTEHPGGLEHLGGRAVLTANPTELIRTAGREEDDDPDLLELATVVARRSRVTVLCGGSEKYVATPEGRCWLVQGGGPGLGVSGSGDVQAGIVAGLLARGAAPEQAATWGAYLHARAGERLAADINVVGYLARELPPLLPRILAELR